MNTLLTLMRREWLQHRFGWAMMAVIPLGLVLLLLGFGQINFDPETIEQAGDRLPAMIALATLTGSAAVIFLVALTGSLIVVSGLARRDHADRSIEFWLSLPTTHSASLGVPLAVHLLLVPVAALLAGLAGGGLLSLAAVAKVAEIGSWFAVPWPAVLGASVSMVLRAAAGLPLAILWLLPLIMLTVLLSAWFKRWSWLILAAGLGLGSKLLTTVFGQPLLSEVLGRIFREAGRAMLASPQGLVNQRPGDELDGLRALPGQLLHDFGLALGNFASPWLLGGLLFAAGCFALVVRWRGEGAGAGG
jgi:hypothetical protein